MKADGKKLIPLFVAGIVLSTAFMAGITNAENQSTITVDSSSGKDWTFMFYDDADFYRAFDPLDMVATQMRSSDHLNVLVLQDKEHGPGKLWYIDENHEKIFLKELGEINMGDYTTLRDFVDYCKNNYSSERYMLVLYDHGMAWRGACIDNTNGSDYLTMEEIRDALSESGGVDVIGFSGCLMGCVESAYELREVVDVYIGSEEMNGCGSWPWKDISDILDNYCSESTYSISKRIIDAFRNLNPYFGDLQHLMESVWCIFMYHRFLMCLYPPAVTMSAINCSKLEDLVSAVDNLSIVLSQCFEQYRKTINRARLKAEDFPYPMSIMRLMGEQVDLYDYVKLLKKSLCVGLRKELDEVFERVEVSVDNAVIAEYHQVGHRRSHGVSVYFPFKYSKQYEDSYTQCGLDFTDATHWDEFLQLYLTQ